MKKLIFLFIATLLSSHFVLAKSSLSLPNQTLVTGQARYDNEDTATKDAKLQINDKCFSELKGERLIYQPGVTTVLPSNNTEFGNTFDVIVSGICFLNK